MDERVFYDWLVIAWMALAAVTFVALFFVTAPYGRFTRGGWGPRLGARWGWILMESPSLITMVVLFAIGDQRRSPVAIVLLILWVAHYFHRSFVYPFRLHSSRPSMALSIILMAVAFNVGNGYLNGRYLFFLGPGLQTSWFTDPRFIIGFVLFVGGYTLNQHSRQSPDRPAQTGRERLQDPPRRRLPFRELSQLPRGDGGVGRLGADVLEPGGARVPRLDGRQPGAPRFQDPPLVPPAVLRLPARAQGAHPLRPLGGHVRSSTQIRANAPVARSVFWVMIPLIAWEVFQGVRADAAVPVGSWSHTWFDLVFIVLLPALSAFAFTRLFLVLTQSNRGTLNVYSVISSPYAWMFWVGLAIGLCGYGIHTAAHSLARAMPSVLAQGEFAAKIHFLDVQLGYTLLGFGFFLATIAIIFLARAGHRDCPGRRAFCSSSARSPPTERCSSTWGSRAARSSAP